MLIGSALEKATFEQLTSLPTTNLKGRFFMFGSKLYYNNGTENIELISVAGAGGVDIGTYTIFNTHGGTVDFDTDYFIEANGVLIDDVDSPLNGKYIESPINLPYPRYKFTTSQVDLSSNPLRGSCYGNGIYVVVGDNGVIFTSSDLSSWTSRTSGVAEDLNRVIYANSLFVVVGKNNTLLTSTDGVTWTSRTSGFGVSDNINDIVYGNSLFVIVGQNENLSTSPDGITWTSRTSNFSSGSINAVGYANSLFLAGGQDNSQGEIIFSTDGITWTQSTSSFNTNDINGICYGQSKFIVGGDNETIATSTDITSDASDVYLTQRSLPRVGDINDVAYGNGAFCAVGEDTNRVFISGDGINWIQLSSGAYSEEKHGVSYSNNKFLLTMNDGYISVGEVENIDGYKILVRYK